jgi:hypothetical protein
MGQCVFTTVFPFLSAEMLNWVAMNYGETFGRLVSSLSSADISANNDAWGTRQL